MEFILKEVIIPLVLGVAIALIVERILRHDQPLNLGIVLGTGVSVAIVLAIVASQLTPPYRVVNTSWCLKDDNALQVTGRLTTLILGSPVPDYAVQIKVFETGEESPFKDRKLDTTGVDGTFVVEFDPPGPTPDKNYLINTAYSYDTILFGERWIIRDFRRGHPPACSSL